MKKYLALLLFLSCCFTTRGGDPKKDLEGLQGTWQVDSMIERGKKPADDDVKALLVTIAKDVLVVSERGKKVSEFTMKIDPVQKPKTYDLTCIDGKSKGKVLLGIYELTGDALKVCINEESQDAAKDRPKEFASTEKTTFTLIQLKRKK